MTNWLARAGLNLDPVPKDMPVPIAPKGANSPPVVSESRETATVTPLLAPNGAIGTSIPNGTSLDVENIREQFEERAAIAEFDGGLSRTEAELLAWDEIRTCVQCHRDTEGEATAVRMSGGGWLHMDGCYDQYFGFRRRGSRP